MRFCKNWIQVSPLALESWASPPWGVLSASPGAAVPAPLQTRPGCTGARCCDDWTCPECYPPGWARWWSPVSWWSSTRWHSWNAHSSSSAVSPFWGWKMLEEKEAGQWSPGQQRPVIPRKHPGTRVCWGPECLELCRLEKYWIPELAKGPFDFLSYIHFFSRHSRF